MFLKMIFITFFLALSPWGVARDIIDRGDFGSFARSLSHKEYAYQIVKDPTGKAPTTVVEKFIVKHGDCGFSKSWNDCDTDRERSELSEKGRGNQQKKTFWYGWSLFIPESYPQIFPAKVALGQFHQDEGNPLWIFQQSDMGYELEAIFLSDSKKFPLVSWKQLKGQWNKIEMEVFWTPSPDGFLRVWINGEQKVNYQGPTQEKGKVYFKYGLYRSFLSRYKTFTEKKELPTQEVYYSNVKRAKSRNGLQPHG